MCTTQSTRLLQLTELFDSFLTISNVHTVGSSVDTIGCNIFIGTRDFVNTGHKFHELGITHLLNVCNDLKHTDRNRIEFAKVSFAHVSFKAVKQNDRNCLSLFRMTSAFIRKAVFSGGKILVCSLLGVNQAAAVVIAYLIETYRISLERASLIVAMKRLISPSRFLLKQLVQLSDAVLGSKVGNGAIDLEKRFHKTLEFVNGVGSGHVGSPSIRSSFNGARMITYNLYVGNETVITDVVQLAKYHISYLLDLRGTDYVDSWHQGVEGLKSIKSASIGQHENVSFDLDSFIELCVSFIGDCLQRGERLLVFGNKRECLVNVVITAYIMESHGVSVEEALKATTDRRCIYLGVDYLRYLFAYEKKLSDRKEKRLQRDANKSFYFPSDYNTTKKLNKLDGLNFLRISKETSL